MAKFKTSAIPVVSDAASEFDSDAAKNQIAGIQDPGSVTVSSVITNILAVVSAAVQILIDPFKSTGSGKQGRVIAAIKEGSITTTLQTELPGSKRMTLIPSVGQSGRVLAFEEDETEVGFNAEAKAALLAIIAPAAPKFNVGALATKLVTTLPTANGKKYAVIVDQAASKVTVLEHIGDASATLIAEVGEAGRVTVDLDMTPAPDAPSSPDTSLPFEGGEIA